MGKPQDHQQNASYKHMILTPDGENVSFRQVFRFLFSDDISQSSDVLEQTKVKDKYLRRWFIFLCLLLQVVLLKTAQPMKKFGSKLEHWLNRKVVPQDEESSDYISFLGHLDKRLELDKEIRHEECHGKYYAVLSMLASKLAYENQNVIQNTVSNIWKMQFLAFYKCENEFQARSGKKTTEAYIFQENNKEANTVFIAFRGTSPFDADDWCTDFDISWCKIHPMGKTHYGFIKALGLRRDSKQGPFHGIWPKELEEDKEDILAYYAIRKKLRQIIHNNKDVKFIVTGHSLGGALAILFPAILALHGEVEILDRFERIYTFGQPRVGDETFKKFMEMHLKKHGIEYYRVVYKNDIVPRLPLDDSALMFKHHGTCIYFDSFYQGKIVAGGEQERDYCSLVSWVTHRVNAVWELTRGFIIPYAEGLDYKEGWVLIVFRILGILLPGASAHSPQDYVNATRLASPHLFRGSTPDR